MATADQDKNLLATVLHILSRTKPLLIDDINSLSLEEQSNILTLDRISTIQKRKAVTNSLYTKLPDLKNTAYKRIRFKSLLSSYHKAHIELNSLSVQEWNTTQLPLSLLFFVADQLQNTLNKDNDEKTLKKQRKDIHSSCRFIGYTLQFCNEEKYNGEQLYAFWSQQNKKKAGGFALKFVQKICKKYGLKFGQFAKVKKWIGTWISNNIETKKIETKSTSTDTVTVTKVTDDKKEKEEPIKTTVSTIEAPTPHYPTPSPEPVMATSKWYWMDMEELCWTPYKEDDQQILNQSYANKEKKCDVDKGQYRVEFEMGTAAGNQFENNGDDDTSYMVVRADPEDGEIHGMPCADQPK